MKKNEAVGVEKHKHNARGATRKRTVFSKLFFFFIRQHFFISAIIEYERRKRYEGESDMSLNNKNEVINVINAFSNNNDVLNKNESSDQKEAKANAMSIQDLDDDKQSLKPLKILSKDNKEFTLERKHALISTLIKTSLENDDKAEDVPIPGVTAAVLELVVDYMKEHKGVEPPIIEKPLRSKVMKDICPHKWDADYIDKIGETRQQLYDLILAANYLDIKSLLHLGCAKVASLIKGQPLEKIKEILDPNQKQTIKQGTTEVKSDKTDTKDSVERKDDQNAKKS